MAHASIAERVAFGRPLDPVRDEVAAQAAPRPTTALIARFLIAAIFVTSGAAKLMDLGGTAGYMAAEGIPAARTLAIVVGIAELAGGLSIAAGFLTRVGAIGLSLFLIPTTLIFHDFWTFAGAQRATQLATFMKNLAIVGGLGLLIAFGPGRYSVDAKLRHHG